MWFEAILKRFRRVFIFHVHSPLRENGKLGSLWANDVDSMLAANTMHDNSRNILLLYKRYFQKLAYIVFDVVFTSIYVILEPF